MGVSLPNKPSASSLVPAVKKKSLLVLPSPPPRVIDHRPLIDRIIPLLSSN